MKGSQYTVDYLNYNESNNPISTSTFLSKVLRGRAKTYKGRYQYALEKELDSMVQEGKVKRGVTKLGAVCWLWEGGEG